jgi:Mn2+/Fe2+ NRAMP family transporter
LRLPNGATCAQRSRAPAAPRTAAAALVGGPCYSFGWEWGKYRHNAGAPRFTLTWIAMLVVGLLIVVGVDPILVTELSVIFAVVALPLTYLPILLVANDRAYMGRHSNGVLANVFGIFYLVVVLVIAAAAIPLLLLSNMGQG